MTAKMKRRAFITLLGSAAACPSARARLEGSEGAEERRQRLRNPY
jgi:hypothetical protein